jgi:O-acetyl-ADP-ribose deacetylase (regulator of RNase III)
MITYLKGDATRPQGDELKIIAHVCNTEGGWGAGFVCALSKRWGKPERDYRIWHRDGFMGGSDFGLGEVLLTQVELNLLVASMLAQEGYRSEYKGPPIRYDALEKCLGDVGRLARVVDASVHMPRIGCGLGGGRWDQVEPIIQRTLIQAGIRTFVYDLP